MADRSAALRRAQSRWNARRALDLWLDRYCEQLGVEATVELLVEQTRERGVTFQLEEPLDQLTLHPRRKRALPAATDPAALDALYVEPPAPVTPPREETSEGSESYLIVGLRKHFEWAKAVEEEEDPGYDSQGHPAWWRQQRALESRLRRRTRRLGLVLVKTRRGPLHCADGSCNAEQTLPYYLYERKGEEWVEIPWPAPGEHVLLEQVETGLAIIEEQRGAAISAPR